MTYESELANGILINPFDSKASVEDDIVELMTKEEFFRNCYCKPIFQGFRSKYQCQAP